MIQIFAIPMLLVATLIVLLFVLPLRWRNALIWFYAICLAAVWGQYFYVSSKPGHDGRAGEALGLIVMFWVSVVIALGAALSIVLRSRKEKRGGIVLPPFPKNTCVDVLSGKYCGQAGYIVRASRNREKGDYLVALESGFDVNFYAKDLKARAENHGGGAIA